MAVVRTSDEARDLFATFAFNHGVSVAGLLEAIARSLPTGPELPSDLNAVVWEARAIDAENRRRS